MNGVFTPEKAVNQTLRSLRGWLYRQYPPVRGRAYGKKLAGFERRWGLEDLGFTKEGFFRLFRDELDLARASGGMLELNAGDGLVGSLGHWVEQLKVGWRVAAWEHRPQVLQQLRRNRPTTEIHEGRLTSWEGAERWSGVAAITSRGVREATGICRAIRRRMIRPQWLGIWNPSRRPVWFQRLRPENYRLELVWQNIEFYVDGRRGTEDGCRRTDDR